MSTEVTAEVRARLLAKATRAPSGCLIWMGARGGYRGRYGLFSYPTRKQQTTAHRVSHILFIGPIPDGWQVDHLCRNPRCIEPTHLQAVPGSVNNARGTSPSAMNAKKTQCVNGHALTDDNVYRPPSKPGSRYCRACMAASRANSNRVRKPLTDEQRLRKTELQRQRRTAALAGPSPTDEPRKRWLSDREYVIDNPSPTDEGGEGA